MIMNAYRPMLSATVNSKGVLDIDTVKGCACGMRAYPGGGCYGLCYANKLATLYGYDFAQSVSREMEQPSNQIMFSFAGAVGSNDIWRMVESHHLDWFRIGTMGDPCHDWQLTVKVCEWLCELRVPIIITKHWMIVPNDLLSRFAACNTVFNNSISALDTAQEIKHRLGQLYRLREAGIKSVLRIVSCEFGDTQEGRRLDAIQRELFTHGPVIDNPLRIPASDPRVTRGDIIVEKRKDLDAVISISIANKETYIGHCDQCPDQCGLTI